MIWLMLSILSLSNASSCHRRSSSSVSDASRIGATIVSSFLQQNPQFPFSGLNSFMARGPVDVNLGSGEFILRFLKLMGVDHRKMSDFAFDGFIALIRLVNRVLGNDKKTDRTGRTSQMNPSLFRFFLQQPQVVDLLHHMRDSRLVDLILKESEEKLRNFQEENVECIRLLVCKTKPFVWGMQRSLKFFMRREDVSNSGKGGSCRNEAKMCEEGDEEDLWEKADLETRMFFFVPSLKEALESGDHCDRIFPNCVY